MLVCDYLSLSVNSWGLVLERHFGFFGEQG